MLGVKIGIFLRNRSRQGCRKTDMLEMKSLTRFQALVRPNPSTQKAAVHC